MYQTRGFLLLPWITSHSQRVWMYVPLNKNLSLNKKQICLFLYHVSKFSSVHYTSHLRSRRGNGIMGPIRKLGTCQWGSGKFPQEMWTQRVRHKQSTEHVILRSGSMFFMLSLDLSNVNKEARVIGSRWMDYKNVLFAARKLKARIEMLYFGRLRSSFGRVFA